VNFVVWHNLLWYKWMDGNICVCVGL
jgi:hypothetical protein